MSKGWEKFFFILSFLFQGSSYLSPYAYGILHRLHHAHADTEKDPHSPKIDSNFFTMMWRTRLIYNSIFDGKMQLDPAMKKDLPEWRSFDEFASSRPARAVWALIYIGIYVAFATQWWMYLLIPIHILMGPTQGVVINWFAHKYGYINFKLRDTSHNLMPVDIFMLGEGFHNNHHKYGSRPNFGFKWWELDPVYGVIKLLNAVGVISLKKASISA